MIDWIESQASWDLIILPDAGSYDAEEHKKLLEMGIDCLCLDHHAQLYGDDGQPIISIANNTIVINNQLSENYSNKSLCGAGIVYKFCEVMDDTLGINIAPYFLDLVALGEIADVMDRTTSETNYLIMAGLHNIRNEGFKTLLESQSFSLKDKAMPPYIGLTPTDIAFYIAPLINAINRVGTIEDKRNLFYCFVEPFRTVDSTKRGAKPGDTEFASNYTARVGKNAKSRQDTIKERAMDLIDFKIQKDQLNDNNIIILTIDEEDKIPQEMTGLIAMNVVTKYNKPCIIGRFNEDNNLQGSLRSNNNFEGLPSFKLFLEQTGLMNFVAGHDAAGGFSINGKKINNLIDYANTHLSASDFENCYIVDYILNANDNNYDLLWSLAQHPEYFGNHIDEIKIVIKNIPLVHIMIMGANKDSIKISNNNIDYVRFKDIDFIEQVSNNRQKLLDIFGRININNYNGKQTLQIFCDDYELHDNNDKYAF